MQRRAKKSQRTVRNRKRPGATILVIEDEPFVRDVTCEVLRDAGYAVVQAECAEAGCALFARYEKRIQLLLCDAVLPDSSGIALLQALRRRSPGLKVVLASGYPRGEFDEDSTPSGATEFLAKPYGAASLMAKIQNALQGGHGRQSDSRAVMDSLQNVAGNMR